MYPPSYPKTLSLTLSLSLSLFLSFNNYPYSYQMTSLSLPTKIYLYPNSPSIQFQSQQHRPQKLTFTRKIKIICSATEPPQQPPPPPKQPKKKKNVTEGEKGVDPVGFLTKHGISNKAFAQFLRERYNYKIITEKKIRKTSRK